MVLKENDFIQLKTIILSNAERQINQWYHTGQQHLKQFESFIITIAHTCTQQKEDWHRRYTVAEELSSLRQWINSTMDPPNRQEQWQTFEENWHETLDFAANLPEDHLATINPIVYRIADQDPLVLKWRKHTMACIEWHRRWWFTLKRLFKGKKSSSTYQSQRSINCKLFIQVNHILPAARELLQEWNRYYRCLGSLSQTFQDVFENISRLEQDKIADANSVQAIAETLNGLSDTLSQERKAALDRTRKTLDDIFSLADHYWRRAGTLLYSVRRFNAAAWGRSKKKYLKSARIFRSAWNNHWHGESMDWQKDIDLSGINWDVLFNIYQLDNSISDLFAQQVEVRFQMIKDILATNIQQIQKSHFTAKRALSSFITQNRDTVKRELTDNYLPQTIDTMTGLGIDRHLDNCTQNLKAVMEQMEKEYIIFKMKDSEHLVPESQIENVPLKEIIINQPFAILLKTITDLKEQIQVKVIRITNDISSLADALNYNGETAQDLIYTSEAETTAEIIDDVLNTLQTGFNRASDRLAEIRETTKKMADAIIENLFSAAFDFIQEVELLRKNDHLLKIKLELAQARVRLKVAQWYTRFVATLRKTVNAIRLLFIILHRFSKRWANLFYQRLSNMARLKETDIKDIRLIQDYLKQTNEYIEVQPVVYRRLFSFTPLSEERFFVGRQNECRDFGESFNRWLKGNTGLIALVGERGSGRTTLVRIMSQKIFQNIAVNSVRPDIPLLSIDSLFEFLKEIFKKPRATSLDKLEEMLIDEDERMVVIVEDLHRMFLKTIDGLNTIQRFTLFMMHTDKTIFWIISCSYYAWNFLDRVIGIGSLFGTVLYLSEFSAEELEQLLMRRHRLSGIRLTFTADKVLNRSKQFRKLSTEADREEWLKNRYMKQLEEVSTGNISVAMLFWLRSIRVASDSRFEIEVSHTLTVGSFRDLSPEDLFALAALIQHEALSIPDFALVMNLPLDSARIRLISLHNRGIVIEKGEKYELHFFLYRSIIRLLNEKRFLH